MRVVIQRVSEASVTVNGEYTGRIGLGLAVLLGIAATDTEVDAEYLIERIVGLRIFPDEAGKFDRSVQDVNGSILVVSQFTLYGDCRKGRRPSFSAAAGPDKALPLYDYFIKYLKAKNIAVATGRFQAMMAVQLINDGPVTLIIDSPTPRE
jgi:D-tyrosyl-tRNA(Tyr) deacylase